MNRHAPPAALRLLIVEDEALVAMEIESILCDAGHDVVGIADNLVDAVAIAKATRPDLALVDMHLVRGESGLAVAAALRAIGIVSMFVTGNCPGDGGAALAIGCLDKPFSDTTLTQAVVAVAAVIGGARPATLPASFHLY